MSDLKDQVVSAIQGNPVSANTPQTGQFLMWNGQWTPSFPNSVTSPATFTSNNDPGFTINMQNIGGSGTSGLKLTYTDIGGTFPSYCVISSDGSSCTITSPGAYPLNLVSGSTILTINNGGIISLNTASVSTTSPAAGGAGVLPTAPAGYLQVSLNGNPQFIPYY